jgi:hypothetical protein
MSKKSEKTLAKEAKWKKDIETLVTKWKAGQPHEVNRPGMAGFTILPGVLKSPYDDVIIKHVHYSPVAAAWMRVVFEELTSRWDETWHKLKDSSYLFGEGLFVQDAELIAVAPMMSMFADRSIAVSWGKSNMRLMSNLPIDPAVTVHEHMFIDEAVAMTWPDEMGRAKAYVHKGSKLARIKFPKVAWKADDHDGLNRAGLKKLTKWLRLVSTFSFGMSWVWRFLKLQCVSLCGR